MEKLYLWVAYIIIALVIVISLASYVNNQFTEGGFVRGYVARDISLFFDAVRLSDGSLDLDYNTKIPFDFSVDGDFIYVSDRETGAVAKYPYTKVFSQSFNFNKELVLCGLEITQARNALTIKEGACS